MKNTEQVEADASRAIEAILMQCAQHADGGEKPLIKLSVFPTLNDFRFVRPTDPWTWEHHNCVLSVIRKRLHAAGYKVKKIKCTAGGLMSWLDANGKTNTPQTRAEYIGAMTT